MAADPSSYIAEDFGIDLSSLEPIGGGIDRAAQNFRGRSGPSTYAVKWSSGGSAAGLVLPSTLAARGVRGVAAPLRTLDGRLHSEREGRRLSVAPWVGERQGIDGGLDAEQWRTFGRVLAATHALPVTRELEAVLPRADHHADAAAARDADASLRAGNPLDQIAADTQRVWLEHAADLSALAARVEELAAGVTRTNVCHTDPHLGNVLAGPGRVWLIDWDDAALSTPEQDLMFVLGGTYGDEHIGDRERAWLFEGYGESRGEPSIDPHRLAYWRCSRALVDVAGLADEAFRAGEFDDGWRATALRLLRGNFAAGGFVSLALG